jgi:hypothetical protein
LTAANLMRGSELGDTNPVEAARRGRKPERMAFLRVQANEDLRQWPALETQRWKEHCHHDLLVSRRQTPALLRIPWASVPIYMAIAIGSFLNRDTTRTATLRCSPSLSGCLSRHRDRRITFQSTGSRYLIVWRCVGSLAVDPVAHQP